MSETKNRRILIVDDNRSIHDDFRKILGARQDNSELDELDSALFGESEKPATGVAGPVSYEIDSAYQGQEALAVVKKELEAGRRYATAFVDMRMPPGWDGVETIQHLWEADPDVQVVICTAYSEHSWESILQRFGATDRLLILRKPFDTAEVCQLACALTEKWHLARHAHLKLTQLRAMVDEQTRELAQEVNERRRSEQALLESEQRYARAAAGANDGLWDWDLAGHKLYLAPRWKEMLGMSIAAPADGFDLEETWFGRVHPDEQDHVKAAIDAHLSGATEHFAAEYRILHEDGQYRWVLCRGLVNRDTDGAAVRMAGSQTDITDRKLAEEQLRHDALHDPLTGLGNRAMIGDRIDRCLAHLRRGGATSVPFAVVYMDLDRFKLVNDSLGHLAGDKLLTEVARRIEKCIRNTDTSARPVEDGVARVGGDEFVILLEGLARTEDVILVTERLGKAICEPYLIEGHEAVVGASFGIAIGDARYKDPGEMLRDADTALYRAKSAGRGRTELFDPTMHASVMQRWQLENDLRKAVERGELLLHYQPVACLQTGHIKGFEALIRWQHPTRGFMGPGDFIPLAEETGLIVPMGEWALKEAATQLRRWEQDAVAAGVPDALKRIEAVSVAVNLAQKQLLLPELADHVRAALKLAGDLDPQRLHLEITENAVIEKADKALSTLASLRAIGCPLHLDDFGTGYSSLSYLHRLPVDALKIDRSFISNMIGDSMSASIVQAIVTLAHALKRTVIAEGVETPGQLEHLRSIGCNYVQGYVFAKPLSAAAALELLLKPAAFPFFVAPAGEVAVAA